MEFGWGGDGGGKLRLQLLLWRSLPSFLPHLRCYHYHYYYYYYYYYYNCQSNYFLPSWALSECHVMESSQANGGIDATTHWH